ncbi:MAG TPA: hypothetical protein VGO47_09945, partial [Chlamydiales bacterium]|nr:hypothetical protein [Chlamydiales bacterium]
YKPEGESPLKFSDFTKDPITGLVGHVVMIGIDCGHVREYQKILTADGTPHFQGWKVESNTGMAIVIPAWRLSEFLDKPALVMQRREKETQYQKEQQSEEYVTLDSESQRKH